MVSYRSTLTFLVTAINLAGVRFLGEVEFWLSSVKIIALIGLILFGIFVDAGVNPQHHVIGFTYYRPPYGPFGSYLEGIVGVGDTSRFLGVCSVMSTYLGSPDSIKLSESYSKCIVCISGDRAGKLI